jgi:hypothetical protein
MIVCNFHFCVTGAFLYTGGKGEPQLPPPKGTWLSVCYGDAFAV